MTNVRQDDLDQKAYAGGHARVEDPQLTGAALKFDLTGEVRELKHEETWARTGQNAKTLVKHPDFRIVLIALRAGARIQEHQAGGRVSIQCLSGRLRLLLPDQTVELGPNSLLALDKSLAHEVEALEESALLLSISWPQGVQARE